LGGGVGIQAGGKNDFFQSVHHTYYNYLFIRKTILGIKAGVNRPAGELLLVLMIGPIPLYSFNSSNC